VWNGYFCNINLNKNLNPFIMRKKYVVACILACALSSSVQAQRVTDKLDRGLVAIKTSNGVFCSWRVNAEEYYDVTYNLYRNGVKVNDQPLSVSNYTDVSGSTTDTYTVRPVVKGKEQSSTETAAKVLDNDYVEIAKPKRLSNDGKTDVTDVYQPNDATIADVDGDGQMELIVKQICTTDDPKNKPDGPDFDRIEVFKLNGQLLWWIDCGPNLCDFQHNETNIAAYDWDGDGKAECIMRAADGTTIHTATGKTIVIGDKTKNYRADCQNGSMSEYFVHSGSEFLLYMNGQTGEPYQIGPSEHPDYMDYPLKRLEDGETDLKKAWGDGYGHRSSKNFFGAPYLDGHKPSIFLARGIYTRHKMIALDVDPASHQLTTRWRWNCNTPGSAWYGQGYHNYSIADVDWDGRDEICFGSMVIDDNGKGLSTTGLGHGDAQHVGNFDPYRHGQEIFACNEDAPSNNYRDATTSKIYYRLAGGSDDGRSMMGNFTDKVPGAIGSSGHDTPVSAVTAKHIGDSRNDFDLNFRIYWDGDLLEETLNGTEVRNSTFRIHKYGAGDIKTLDGSLSNNDTKATPCFQGDIFGDWREEVVARTADNKIRIYTTTDPTEYRNCTLLSDKQYRNAMVWQMNGYNQPPHVSYFLGKMEGITVAPPPETTNGRTVVDNGGSIGAGLNDKQVMLDETNDMTVSVSDGAAPYIFFDNAPTWVQGHDDNNNITTTVYTHTLTGGAFSGAMRLIKQGDGTLVLPKVDERYTGNTDVWAGTLAFDGTLKNSALWLNRFAVLSSNGGVFRSIKADYGASILPGGRGSVGTITTDTLKLGFGSIVSVDIDANGKADQLVVNKAMGIETKDWTQGPAYLTPRFQVNFISGTVKPGTYTLGQVSGVEGDVSNIVVTGLKGHKATLALNNGVLSLAIADTRAATTVEWSGAQGSTWNLSDTENFTNTDEKKSDVFVSGDKVVFNDKAQSGTVVISGEVTPASITFDNSKVVYDLSGDAITGNTTITKKGSALATLHNVNDFTGSTIIADGTLAVDNLGQKSGVNNGALGYYNNNVTLNGGTLEALATMTTDHPFVLGAKGGTVSVDEGKTLTLNTSITGSGNTLTKTGKGMLTLAPSANYGTLNVMEGWVNSQEQSNVHGYPKNIVLNNGTTLSDADNMYSYSSNGVNVKVPEGATASWYLDSRCNYKGSLTGSGTLNLYSRNIRAYLQGNWGDFTGKINIAGKKTGNYAPMLFVQGSLKNAEVSSSIPLDNNGSNVTVGSLSGQPELDGEGTWSIGGNDKDFTFQGLINGGKLTKTGDGIMTVGKKQTQLGGQVNVMGGTLNINSTSTTISSDNAWFGSQTVSVTSGGCFAGRGIVEKVLVNDGGTLQPGNAAGTMQFGALKTVSGIYLYKGATARFNIYNAKYYPSLGTNGTLSMAEGTTVAVTMSDKYTPKAGDSFTLWDVNTLNATAEGVTLDLPALPSGLAWDSSELFQAKGVLKVVTATGINTLRADEDFHCEVFTANGVRLGALTTTKNRLAADIRDLHAAPGLYIVRVNGGQTMKVLIK
jgi:autotransporter-associated beta strand protein